MSDNQAEPYDVTASDQDVEGDIGVSSGRPGDAGPGQHGPTGVRDTSEDRPLDAPEDSDEKPVEDRPHEQNSQSPPPRSGYSSYDPRAEDAEYQPGRQD